MGGWVFFRAETLDAALHYLGVLAGGGGPDIVPARFYLTLEVQLALAAGALLALRTVPLPRVPAFAAQIAVLALSLLYVAAGTYNPFIYFRF